MQSGWSFIHLEERVLVIAAAVSLQREEERLQELTEAPLVPEHCPPRRDTGRFCFLGAQQLQELSCMEEGVRLLEGGAVQDHARLPAYSYRCTSYRQGAPGCC